MATLPDTVALTVMVPDSVAPEAGEVIDTVDTVGGVAGRRRSVQQLWAASLHSAYRSRFGKYAKCLKVSPTPVSVWTLFCG